MFKTSAKRVGRHATEEDPIRRGLLKQSCDLLVAVGYFRAKMTSLTPFDRVIGGLVWCITSSNVDIDVDILFEENSSIGERIRVSEQVVRSLQMMKCPFTLQSFQIQGLDYESILPVLKWLIKQVIQTRSLTGNDFRTISTRTFDTKIGYLHHSTSSVEINEQSLFSSPAPPIFPIDEFVATSQHTMGELVSLYHQKRMYKRRQDAVFQDPSMKVKATLLEYHDKHIRVTMDLEQHEIEQKKEQQKSGNRSTAGVSDVDEINQLSAASSMMMNSELFSKGSEMQQLQEQHTLQSLQGQLEQGEASLRINSGFIGSLLTMNDRDIAAKDQYMQQETQAINNSSHNIKDQREIEQQRHIKQCEVLTKKINDVRTLFDVKQQEFDEINAVFNTAMAEYNVIDQKYLAIKAKIKALEEIENNTDNKAVFEELKRYVVLNETLKKDESLFKQSCKEQYTSYKESIVQLMELLNDNNSFISACNELESLIKKDSEKLARINDILYQRHMELLTIYHKIDEVPTRGELLQFEKRFIELYQINAAKLIETRSYFTLYNTLQTTYSYLQQELTLLESILNNFSIGMKTERSQKEMQQQMSTILNVMMENIESTETELNSETENETVYTTKYNKLMAKEREYYKLLQKFQNECDLNTRLTKQVQQQTE